MNPTVSGSTNLSIPRPSMPNNVLMLPLEHFGSRDYFQQMLSIDSALEALSSAKCSLAADKLLVENPVVAPDPEEEEELKQALGNNLIFEMLRSLPPAPDLAELDAIDQSIASLNTLVKTFEEVQTTARHHHALRAQSLREKNIDIMGFPDELLSMIFDNFRPLINTRECRPIFADDESDIGSIRAIQQTCKRFRKNSSHLLVRRLDISPNILSLQRLEEVLKHEEIWRAEQVLRIDLRYYSATLAQDFQAFSELCIDSLEYKISRFSEMRPDDDQLADLTTEQRARGKKDESKGKPKQFDSEEESKYSEEESEYSEEESEYSEEESEYSLGPQEQLETRSTIREKLQKGYDQACAIQSSWRDIADGDTTEESADVDEAALALLRAHDDYRRLYQQQWDILQNGRFARAIATAAADSKSRVWLTLWDGTVDRWDFPYGQLEHKLDEHDRLALSLFPDPNKLVESAMVRPRQWFLADSGGEDEGAPRSLLYEIPLAMHTAGAQLAGLSVDISFFPRNQDLRLTSDQLPSLAEATKDLRTISFRLKSPEDAVDDGQILNLGRLIPEKTPGLYTYLLALLGSQNVTGVSLCLDLDESATPTGIRRYFFPVAPLLRSLNWHTLKWANLWCCDISLEDLRTLVGMLRPSISLGLKNVHLTSGTWAAALDCLRLRVGQGSYVVSPSGLAWKSLGYYHVFRQEGLATQYINSVNGVQNPFVDSNGDLLL